ncbi:TPA: hypothetical protein WIW84_000670 [Neisseria meningitidis]|nr:hypothetical protein [Neisseria meningitidis]
MPSEAFRRHFQHRNFKEKEPIPPFPRKTENQKRNLKSVIPEQTGIQSVRFPFFFFLNFGKLPNRHSRKNERNQKLKFRHSRAGGNLETQSCKNLSKMTEAQKTGFLRKQESGVSGLAKPFYPISFRTDRPRFPPSRE